MQSFSAKLGDFHYNLLEWPAEEVKNEIDTEILKRRKRCL